MQDQRAKIRVIDFFAFLGKLKLSTYKMNHVKATNFVLKHKLTNPAGRTERKMRTTGHSIYNDSSSFFNESIARKKINKRYAEGLCVGCGNTLTECRCKRKNT